MVDEQFRPEGGIKPCHQPVGHGLTGKSQPADRADFGGRKAGRLEEVMVQRWHQVERADPLAFDQRQRRRRIEPALADEMPAHDDRGEQGPHSHGVVERHDPEEDLARPVQVLGHVGHGGGAFRPVAARHPLAAPGGSRGVEHHRGVVGRGGRRDSPRTAQILPRRAGGAVEPHETDVGDARAGLDPVRDQRFVDQDPRLGVCEHMADLLGRCPPVERGDHQAGQLAGDVKGCCLVSVGQQGHDVVARPEAEPQQAAGKLACRALPLAPGQPQGAVAERNPVGLARRACQEPAAEIEHQPVSPSASSVARTSAS